ncbi:MAG: hypothetical protein ACFFCW_40710, partial [Candidatus Hodarchaeota archaeon]
TVIIKKSFYNLQFGSMKGLPSQGCHESLLKGSLSIKMLKNWLIDLECSLNGGGNSWERL